MASTGTAHIRIETDELIVLTGRLKRATAAATELQAALNALGINTTDLNATLGAKIDAFAGARHRY